MQKNTTRQALLNALFENYESIYVIDTETGEYSTYYESEEYRELEISKSGPDFFADLLKFVPVSIHPEDRAFVLRSLNRETLKDSIRKEEQYSFFYRIKLKSGTAYYRIRAVIAEIEGREYFLLGVSNIDAMMKREREHREEIESMRRKERAYLTAILGSAEGYLEANLTKDIITDHSEYFDAMQGEAGKEALQGRGLSYSGLNEWICSRMSTSEKESFMRICSRENLLQSFGEGERRASLQFFSKTADGRKQPCRYLIFLYQDSVTEDVHAFCVLYDLTEQQRKDLELRKLEEELRRTRISNFTSQMQPHFLYNTLGSIQEIMHEDPEYASGLLGDFTVHLRSCIRAMSGDRLIPFEQELDNIRAYANIEKMRFGEKLKVEYDIKEKDFLILPLSVQPVVENAIRHGIYGRGAAGGCVRVSTRREEDAYIVEVEDDGTGFDAAPESYTSSDGDGDHTGLRNLSFRLKAVMNGRVEIHSIQGSGTRVTISLPAEKR